MLGLYERRRPPSSLDALRRAKGRSRGCPGSAFVRRPISPQYQEEKDSNWAARTVGQSGGLGPQGIELRRDFRELTQLVNINWEVRKVEEVGNGSFQLEVKFSGVDISQLVFEKDEHDCAPDRTVFRARLGLTHVLRLVTHPDIFEFQIIRSGGHSILHQGEVYFSDLANYDHRTMAVLPSPRVERKEGIIISYSRGVTSD